MELKERRNEQTCAIPCSQTKTTLFHPFGTHHSHDIWSIYWSSTLPTCPLRCRAWKLRLTGNFHRERAEPCVVFFLIRTLDAKLFVLFMINTLDANAKWKGIHIDAHGFHLLILSACFSWLFPFMLLQWRASRISSLLITAKILSAQQKQRRRQQQQITKKWMEYMYQKHEMPERVNCRESKCVAFGLSTIRRIDTDSVPQPGSNWLWSLNLEYAYKLASLENLHVNATGEKQPTVERFCKIFIWMAYETTTAFDSSERIDVVVGDKILPKYSVIGSVASQSLSLSLTCLVRNESQNQYMRAHTTLTIATTNI